MSRSWPARDRLEYAYRLIEEGVACPEPGCGEVFLPAGLPGHRLGVHGTRQPKPKKPKR